MGPQRRRGGGISLGQEKGTLHSTDPVGDGGQEGAATGSLRNQGWELRVLTLAASILNRA